MNRHQERLLGLLKDIDAFCRKHDITYFCAGGTVIGAARHGGFIPWDDDIDIYMTRPEFRKFAEAFEKDPMPDRCIEYYERRHEHHSVVNRFHETTSTMMCHYHITGRSCAGLLIDVFILDPIPDDPEARHEYLAKFWAYSDLTSPALSYSHRLPAEYLGLYPRYAARIEKEGIPALAKELSDEIFSYDEKDCSDYCLRWGSMPLIYPINAIGEPVYLPFEDMEVPVPRDWYRYLTVHYGCDWVQIPYVEGRREHINILRDDVPYTYFYELRDSMFDQEELMKLHFDRKAAHTELSKAERPAEEWAAGLKSRLCLMTIEKSMRGLGHADAGADDKTAGASEEFRLGVLRRLFDAGEYAEIAELYAPYLEQQTDFSHMGARMHHGGQYRWFFPLIIELSEGETDMLLQSLLRSGKVRLCEKLCGILERGGKDSAAVRRAQDAIDIMNEAASLYYRGLYAECRELIGGTDSYADYPWFNDYMLLSAAASAASDEEAEQIESLYAAVESGGSCEGRSRDAVLKAMGDQLWLSGKTEEAAAVYTRLMKSCRNGMFFREISGRGVRLPDIPLEKPAEYKGNDITRLMDAMIGEIADICERNGIDYCIGKELAARLASAGNPGYSYDSRELWMDAEAAGAFLEAAKRELPDDRRVYSWENDSRVDDFAILYADTQSVCCDLRDIEHRQGIGIHITIRILRRSGAPAKYRKKAERTEFLTGLPGLGDLNLNRLGGGRRRSLQKLLKSLISASRLGRMRRSFFRSCLETEKSSGGGYYYFVNTPGLRPKKYKLAAGDWENRGQLELDGRSVRIPGRAEQYSRGDSDAGNVPPRESLFICRDTNITWDEMKPLTDTKGYRDLDLNAYGEKRKKAVFLDRKVEGIWQKMLDTDV